jgi:hypothetical protein
VEQNIYRFKISVTVSWLADSRTAWSPRREVMEPRIRTVEVEGREAGEKAWRWEGRMRGVARDMVNGRWVGRGMLMSGMTLGLHRRSVTGVHQRASCLSQNTQRLIELQAIQ